MRTAGTGSARLSGGDLEAAVQYALDNGADDVVLYGYSMGGGMCLNLLYESELADRVRCVVMDSPLLDFGGTLDFVGHVRGYPRFMVQFGKGGGSLALRHRLAANELSEQGVRAASANSDTSWGGGRLSACANQPLAATREAGHWALHLLS